MCLAAWALISIGIVSNIEVVITKGRAIPAFYLSNTLEVICFIYLKDV